MTAALPPGTPAILTASEVARLHRVDIKTVSLWAREGNITSVPTPGRAHRFPAAQFAELLNITGWPL